MHIKGDIYKRIIDESPFGYAYHKIICDESGNPVDYTFLEVNEAFEHFTGFRAEDVVNRRATEIFPELKTGPIDWVKIYGEVDLTVKPCEFDAYSKLLKQWYSISAFSPEPGYFVTMRQNISNRIQREHTFLEIESRYRSIFDYAPMGITNISLDGYFLDVNNAFCNMIGYSREELLSKQFQEVTHKEDQDLSRDGLSHMLDGLIPAFSIEKRYVHKDGAIIWVSIASTLLRDEGGSPLYFINMVSDITEQKNKEEHKLYVDKLIRDMGRVAKIGAWEFDVRSGSWSWTEEIYNIHDLDLNFVPGSDKSAKYYTDEAQLRLDRARKAAIEQGIPYDLELEFISAKGRRKWVRTIGKPTFENGKVVKLSGAFQDITARKKAEIALKKGEERYRLIAENVADVISVYNTNQKKFTFVSPSVKKLRGISVEEALQESIENSVSRESYESFQAAIHRNMEDFLSNPAAVNYYVNEVQQLCKNGKAIWVEIATKYQYNYEQELEAVSVIRNIEERKKAEQAMRALSYRDPLTDLHNRRFYEEEKERLDSKDNLPIAVIMADVNGLKLTNDILGHQAGDQLLRHIADTLAEACPPNGIVSRIGGDEFVILITKAEKADAEDFMDHVHKALRKGGEANAFFSISMGYSIKSSGKECIDDVFKEAEKQMYRNKVLERRVK